MNIDISYQTALKLHPTENEARIDNMSEEERSKRISSLLTELAKDKGFMALSIPNKE